jgi:hypothetical protein
MAGCINALKKHERNCELKLKCARRLTWMKKYYLGMGINNMEICLTTLKEVFQFVKFLVYKLTKEIKQAKI